MTDKTERDALLALDHELIALALECVLGENTVTFTDRSLREQAAAIRALAEQPAGAVGDCKWNLIEQCAICHGSGYKPGVNGPRPCLNCDGEGSRSPSPDAGVDVDGLRTLADEMEVANYGNIRNCDHFAARLRKLIDSAGGAKGEPECSRIKGEK